MLLLPVDYKMSQLEITKFPNIKAWAEENIAIKNGKIQ